MGTIGGVIAVGIFSMCLGYYKMEIIDSYGVEMAGYGSC